jgi:hypothetical protein
LLGNQDAQPAKIRQLNIATTRLDLHCSPIAFLVSMGTLSVATDLPPFGGVLSVIAQILLGRIASVPGCRGPSSEWKVARRAWGKSLGASAGALSSLAASLAPYPCKKNPPESPPSGFSVSSAPEGNAERRRGALATERSNTIPPKFRPDGNDLGFAGADRAEPTAPDLIDSPTWP